ncbi:MAG: DJ-1/PfpI family protein [Burkholderiaceae bacterium]|nr:MAG: DJ-1/PfpI family protein [Burkholderiaceae bacterium]TBR75870.1 MAG: DJ-1/PfpI family protein [Burkholderiaceae bacterium]
MTTFALLLFPALAQLDLTGPYEVFCRCPDARVHLVWKSMDPVVTEHGMRILPTTTFSELPRADVLCVPGGFGVNALLTDDETLVYLRQLASGARYITSVCTGALVLGAAGLLRGRRATTHWTAVDYLTAFGATPAPGRTVTDGPVVTGGGVTAGIDFALELAAAMHGRAVAEAIQLAIEYNPAPPFRAGHPDVAPPEITAALREKSLPRQAERAAQVRLAAARLG